MFSTCSKETVRNLKVKLVPSRAKRESETRAAQRTAANYSHCVSLRRPTVVQHLPAGCGTSERGAGKQPLDAHAKQETMTRMTINNGRRQNFRCSSCGGGQRISRRKSVAIAFSHACFFFGVRQVNGQTSIDKMALFSFSLSLDARVLCAFILSRPDT